LVCAAKTVREEFRYEEARFYWEAAFECQPERTKEERAAKANIWYQIAEDDWFRGEWEKGLEGFIRFARDFSDADHRSLQMYAFFEAIPTLVKKIGEELPESTLVQEVIDAAAASENAGERFAGAVALCARGDYDAVLQEAVSSTQISDDPRWVFHCDALTIGICLRQKDYDAAKEIFDRIVEEGNEDSYLTRYVLIDGLMLFTADRHDASLRLHTWYMESPVYTDPARRNNRSNRIRLNYAIDLMYAGRPDDSFSMLQQLYSEEFETDQGQQAGLIIAEHFLNRNELDRAESIVRSVLEVGEHDRDLWARGQMVLAQVQKAKGSPAMAQQTLRKVLDLPSRPGEQDIETYKRDAQGFLNRLSKSPPGPESNPPGLRAQ
ncbi:MAG: hypothetical protein ABIH23_11985, partial [bacterium]